MGTPEGLVIGTGPHVIFSRCYLRQLQKDAIHPLCHGVVWCGQEKHGSPPQHTHKRFIAVRIPSPLG